MPDRFHSDRRLTVRMGLTLFLLGLLYVGFVAALIVLLRSWVLVAVLIGALFVAQFWFSDRIALFAMRGRPVAREEYPELHAWSTGCARSRTCRGPWSPCPRWTCRTRSRPGAVPTTPWCV